MVARLQTPQTSHSTLQPTSSSSSPPSMTLCKDSWRGGAACPYRASSYTDSECCEIPLPSRDRARAGLACAMPEVSKMACSRVSWSKRSALRRLSSPTRPWPAAIVSCSHLEETRGDSGQTSSTSREPSASRVVDGTDPGPPAWSWSMTRRRSCRFSASSSSMTRSKC